MCGKGNFDAMKTAPAKVGRYLYVYRVVKADNVMINGLVASFRANTDKAAERKAIVKAAIFGPNAKLIFVKRI